MKKTTIKTFKMSITPLLYIMSLVLISYGVYGINESFSYLALGALIWIDLHWSTKTEQ